MIKAGRLLGRFFISKTSPAEREQLKLRLKEWKKEDKTRLFENILNAEELERRRTERAECDPVKAWEQVQRKLEERKDRQRMRHYSAMIQSAATVAAAVLIAAGAIYYTHVGCQKRVLAQIAQIKPENTHAVLFLADGESLDLRMKDSVAVKADVEIVGENALEYKPRKRQNPKAEEYNTLVTPRGSEYSLKLADGTQVWLNAASRLRFFTANDGAERRVWLEGEAYFEVAHDAKRPFIVESGGQSIRVLGTRFNVNGYDGDRAIYTTLVEGSVAITPLAGGEQVTLQPGQQATYSRRNDDQIAVAAVDTSQATAWMTGTFIFNRASITEIMESLARWYDFEFEVSPLLDGLRFSGQFPRCEELDKILTIIASTGTGMQIDYDGKQITLR
ncbi:FecR domain-containing protein [Alistipes sp. kh20]|uniref:FecR family protein n=1 Tax=Alistipes montrealensis TaxID=2834113 RepID=UPI001BCEB58F|nr:FecR domain-containing protein [Alistipes montrealensis]MBS4766178.1 FecR domain-containing protein [Alistipes montrealensis]